VLSLAENGLARGNTKVSPGLLASTSLAKGPMAVSEAKRLYQRHIPVSPWVCALLIDFLEATYAIQGR
jgi:hypothetical protein